MKKVKAFLELTRIDHAIMLCLAILIGALIAEGNASIKTYIFAFASATFLEMGTFALNDYFDYEVDKRNRRMDRPLVRGDLKPKDAFLSYLIFAPLGVVLSLFVNVTCFFIASLNFVLATLYDIKLKEIKIAGNFYIAFTMAIPFVFGAVAVSNEVPAIIIFFAFLAFFSGAGREIIKDIMDFEGDKLRRTKSFPSYVGIRAAAIFASLLIFSAVVVSFLPYFIKIDTRYYFNHLFLFILILSDSTFIFSLYLLKKREYEKCRKLTLMAMIFALIAFLVGAIDITFIK